MILQTKKKIKKKAYTHTHFVVASFGIPCHMKLPKKKVVEFFPRVKENTIKIAQIFGYEFFHN